MADPRHHKHNVAPAREVVRVGRLERTLQAFNDEIGVKTSLLIREYHKRHVEPRLQALEWAASPWYWKLWQRLKKLARWVWNRLPILHFVRLSAEPESPEDEPSETAEPVDEQQPGQPD